MLVRDNIVRWLRSRLESRLFKFKVRLLSFLSCVTFAKLLNLSVPWLISDACHRFRMGSICLTAPLTKVKSPLAPGSVQIVSLGSQEVSYRTASREALREDGAGLTPEGFGFPQSGSVYPSSQSIYPEAVELVPRPCGQQLGEIRLCGAPLPSLSSEPPAYMTVP